MNESRPTNEPAEWDEEIVAYLDGELEGEQTLALEERLTQEPEMRQRVAELQQSWDMLDVLERPETRENFTESTMELVVAEARREQDEQQPAKGRLFPVWLLGAASWLALAGIAGAAAFAIGARLDWPDDTPVLQNLSTIERVDQLAAVQDLDFIRELRDQELFTDDRYNRNKSPLELPIDQLPSGASLEDRRQYVQQLDNNQYAEFRRKVDVYNALGELARDRVRQIDAELEADPNRQELLPILDRYRQWLETLSSPLRASVLSEPDFAKRIEAIREIQIGQESEFFGVSDDYRLTNANDLKKVVDWFVSQVFDKNREEFNSQFKQGVPDRRFLADFIDYLQVNDEGMEIFFPQESVYELRRTLSAEANILLDLNLDFELQRRLLLQWAKVKLRPTRPSQQELDSHYDTMDEDKKGQLDEMSYERRRQAIYRDFLRERYRNRTP